MKIGVIGVGHLAGYLIDGLMRADPATSIILSPRGPRNSQRLSERYGLPVAESNAEVVEKSDVVVLATRPLDMLDALMDLPWREGQTAISVAAGVALTGLSRAVSPATAVRSLPVTAAKIGESPTCLYPENDIARELFTRLGKVHVFPDEKLFDLGSMYGVVFSVFHATIQSVASWFEDNGLDAETARALSAASFRATSGMVEHHPDRAFGDMVNEYIPEGSLSRITLENLREQGGMEAWHTALDAAYKRCLEINQSTE